MKFICLTAVLVSLTMAFGHESAFSHGNFSTEELEKIYACPRCRKAQPKGPLKRPHPEVKQEIILV